MAVLSTNERVIVTKKVMAFESDNRTSIALTKSDLQAAVNAADSWVDTNAASFNNALPTTARNNLSTLQKSLLLRYVVEQRYLNS